MVVTYDLVLSTPHPNYDFFAHKMRELCGQLGLSFFMAEPVWVKEFLQKLQLREIKVQVLLDLGADQSILEDPYLLLANEVKRQGGYVIDDTDKTGIMAHKGRFHQMLLENQIPVPETVMVSRCEGQGVARARELPRFTTALPIPLAFLITQLGVKAGWWYGQKKHRLTRQAPASCPGSSPPGPCVDSPRRGCVPRSMSLIDHLPGSGTPATGRCLWPGPGTGA